MRRYIEIIVACIGLAILSPMFLLVMLAVKLYDGGPVFHKAIRVGLRGREFRVYKFRTMIVDADKVGAGITSADDRRVTPIGSFLRRYKLDEFPQLINIIRGEMNVVGPRPEDPRYVELYDPEQRKIFSVTPGITSPASLMYKDETSILVGPGWEEKYRNEIIPMKLSIDLKYFENNTFWSDCCVICRTMLDVFRFHRAGS